MADSYEYIGGWVREDLVRSGDAFVDMVRPLRSDELELVDGRVRRLIEVVIRHASDHRSAVEASLESGS